MSDTAIMTATEAALGRWLDYDDEHGQPLRLCQVASGAVAIDIGGGTEDGWDALPEWQNVAIICLWAHDELLRRGWNVAIRWVVEYVDYGEFPDELLSCIHNLDISNKVTGVKMSFDRYTDGVPVRKDRDTMLDRYLDAILATEPDADQAKDS